VKLSDLGADDVEYVGDKDTLLGAAPKALPKLSNLNEDEFENLGKSLELPPETAKTARAPTEAEISPITAATTGAIQAAVPFAAPLAGVGKAAMNAITGVSGPLAGGDLSDIARDYRLGKEQFQGEARRASEANPKIAMTGNIAGGVINPLFKSATSLPKIMGAAGVQGLGLSEADLTKGEVSEALKDTAMGAAGGALGYGAAKAIPAAVGLAGKGAKKFLTTLGPTEEAINARLAGRAKPTTPSYSQLADQMAGTLKKLQGQISNASDEAAQTLKTDPTLPKAYVTTKLDDALSKLGVQGKLIGPTDKRIASTLSSLSDDLGSLGDTISERDLKTIIQRMDENINWSDQGSQKLNNILKGLRSEFDKTLKFQNPDYKKAMTPVAIKMKILENTKKKFSMENVPGEGLVPRDTTASKIQHALSENKAETKKTLGLLEKHTGDDYLTAAKDYQLAKQFQKTEAQGSKRTVLGAGIGYMAGHGDPLAVGLGTAVGSTLDRYGGKVVGGLLDAYVKAGESQAFGKFAPIIEKAAKEGPRALAVAGSILSSNPEFQKIVDRLTAAPPK
jgi:hypothetical protein